MAFKIPTFAEARDFLIALGQALFPDRNYGNARSYHARRAAFIAGAMTQLHAHIVSAAADAMPDSASDDGPIDRWGGIYGVTRKSATPARGSAILRVRGTPATSVAADEELSHPSSGLLFKIAATTTIGAGGYVDADIVAIDTGSATRLDAGQTLEFTSTPVGLETSASLQRSLTDDGLDAEAFGAYRSRVLAAISEPTAGGTQADYAAWMLELAGVSRAYAYGGRAGLGTVDLVGLHAGSGSDRELSPSENAALLAHVRELAPIQVAGAGGPLRTLDVVIQTVNVEIKVEPSGESAYAFDWIGSAVVLSWTPATRVLQFTAARPATMKAGHRIVLSGIASAQDGAELTIEALTSTDSVILSAAPAAAPAATDAVYSGGPLVSPIRNAIVAHMNGETVYAGRNRVPLAESSLESTVRLEVLAEGIGPANPANAYGTWQGGLLLRVLGTIVQYKRGVRNHVIVSPVADVEGTNYTGLLDYQIGLIAPGAVLVRSA